MYSYKYYKDLLIRKNGITIELQNSLPNIVPGQIVGGITELPSVKQNVIHTKYTIEQILQNTEELITNGITIVINKHLATTKEQQKFIAKHEIGHLFYIGHPFEFGDCVGLTPNQQASFDADSFSSISTLLPILVEMNMLISNIPEEHAKSTKATLLWMINKIRDRKPDNPNLGHKAISIQNGKNIIKKGLPEVEGNNEEDE